MNSRIAVRLAGIAGLALLAALTSWSTFAIMSRNRTMPVPADHLTVNQPSLHVVAREGEPFTNATILLENRGRMPATITGVDTKCYCVAVDRYEGRTVEPGKSLRLDLRVTPPDAGTKSTLVSIHYDRESRPLEVIVHATGSRKPPFIVSKGSVSFRTLQATTETKDLVIKTLELAGSAPWLAQISTSLQEFSVSQSDMRDSDSDMKDCVERTYTFKTGWKSLPTSREFSYPLLANTSVPSAEPIVVGSLDGRVMAREWFSPSMVSFSAGDTSSQDITFRLGGGRWFFDQPSPSPTWLSVDWLVSEESTKLRLKLAAPGASDTRYASLKLRSETGKAGKLEVVVLP